MNITQSDIQSNKNYENLLSLMREYNNLVVQAPEGYKKSLMLMSAIRETINFSNNEIAIISCKSYEQLKEKQHTLMTIFGYTDKEVPIIGLSDNYSEYFTNKKVFNEIYKETKIVLMTQAGINQCNHLWSIKYEQIDRKGFGEYKKFIKLIFIDEFDCSMGVIPSLSYAWERHIRENYEDSPERITKSHFKDWIKTNYSPMDYRKIVDCSKDDFSKFFRSYWLESAERENIKVVVATSELLPTRLLTILGFSEFRMDYSENKVELLSHKINVRESAAVVSPLFDRLNSKCLWGIFGFDTIITDRCKPLGGTELNIRSHMTAKGSNEYIGNKKLLTIVSNIPDFAIQEVHDSFQYFTKNTDGLTFNQIKALFYRDRICQAVGRVIGFRGLVKDKEVNEVFLLINENIMKELRPYISEEWMQFYYRLLEDWEGLDTDEFLELEESVILDKRIKKKINNNNNNNKLKIKKEKKNNEIEEKIKNHFCKASENEWMLYTDIKKIIEKNKIYNWNGKLIQQVVVSNFFGCKTKKTTTSIDGKIYLITKVFGIKEK